MLELGIKAPDFELPDQNGEVHKLSDYLDKKIQHEMMRQGNARIIVIHPFVFGMIIFLSLLVESNGWSV